MDMRITSHNVSISAALKSYTEQRVRSAVENASQPLNEVEVRLSDVNGPRGGIDKHCGIRAVLRHTGAVFVGAKGGDLYATIDKAAARLRVAVARRLGRHRSRRRRLDSAAGAEL